METYKRINDAIEESYLFLSSINNDPGLDCKFSLRSEERVKAILQSPVVDKLILLTEIVSDLTSFPFLSLPMDLKPDFLPVAFQVRNALRDYFIKYWNQNELSTYDLFSLTDGREFEDETILKNAIGDLNKREYGNLLDEQKAFDRVLLYESNGKINLDKYDCYLIDKWTNSILRGGEYKNLLKKDYFELHLFSKVLRVDLELKGSMKINPDDNSNWL